MKKWQKILIAIIVLAIIGVAGYTYKNQHNQAGTTDLSSSTLPTTPSDWQSKVITYSGEEGKTVYEILKLGYQVEANEGSSGVMVNSINGLKATDKDFWLYSVNGQDATVAADKYFTKTSDQIKWEYKSF
jgi:uncharacterized protein YxeA